MTSSFTTKTTRSLDGELLCTFRPHLMTGPATLLIAMLTAGYSHTALSETPPPEVAAGIVRSTEGPVHSLEEQGLILSTESPLAPRLRKSTESSNEARQYDTWYDDDPWISEVGTLLYNDADQDGYFTGLSLSIDADTTGVQTDVYISVDIQSQNSAPERLLTSNDFSLYGNSISDEYQIDIELVHSYPMGHYYLTIGLYDAYDQRLLDVIGANDFSNLSALPLESEDQDFNYQPSPSSPYANDDIYTSEYAGGTGLLMLLSLMTVLMTRQRDRLLAITRQLRSNK